MMKPAYQGGQRLALPAPVLKCSPFGKPLTHDLVYRRFHKARRNRFLVAPRFAVIWNECLVDNDIRVEFVERLSEFATILSGELFVIQEGLNNVIEQDHRRIKQRVRPMLGFNQFETAAVTIRGIELAEKIKKQQFNLTPLTGSGQRSGNLGRGPGRLRICNAYSPDKKRTLHKICTRT